MEPPQERPLALAVIVAVGAVAALFLIVASLLTIPFFALARFTEPAHGTGREWFRDGLRWAIIGGAVIALAAGTTLGWWVRKGARIPWENEDQ